MVLDLDLNRTPAPVDDVDVNLRLGLPRFRRQMLTQTTAGQRSTDDNDDDDVVICSPRSFAEARAKARRNREVVEVIDAESDFRNEVSIRSLLSNNPNMHRRTYFNTTAGSGWINLENNEYMKSNNVAKALVLLQNAPVKTASPPPKPPQPILNCPVCRGPFVEETSTKCGHIFCKECIRKSLAVQGKCPTCRRKMKLKDTLRVYLPAAE